jgi:hypothetical protein
MKTPAKSSTTSKRSKSLPKSPPKELEEVVNNDESVFKPPEDIYIEQDDLIKGDSKEVEVRLLS